MGVGAGLSVYVVVVQKFTFAISSPDEFLLLPEFADITNPFLIAAALLFIPVVLTIHIWAIRQPRLLKDKF